MAEIYDWDVDEANNGDASPHGWPEFMAPSAVNDSGREMMAVIARYRESAEACTDTGGTGNAYTIDVEQTITTLQEGMRFAFCARNTSVAGPGTLVVNLLAAKPLVGTRSMAEGVANRDLLAGEIRDGFIYLVAYDDKGEFQILNPTITDVNGQVDASRIPATLTGKDADSVDGLHISTAATGDDANTLYFRTA